MRILIIGHGAREHALVSRFVSEGHEVVVCHKKQNVGIERTANACWLVPDYTSAPHIVDKAVAQNIDLIVPSDEEALFSGVADEANRRGIPCSGHEAYTATVLEQQRPAVIAAIPCRAPLARPAGKIAHSYHEIMAMIRDTGAAVVIKPIATPFAITFVTPEADIGWRQHIKWPAWVETYVEGMEFSTHLFYINGQPKHLGVTLDYPFTDSSRRALTGGMGAVALPDDNSILSAAIIQRCTKATIDGVERLAVDVGIRPNGFISAQFRATARGVIFTEMDCKPGNPEIIALLPTLRNDFVKLLTDPGDIPLRTNMTVIALSMAPRGYPKTLGVTQVPAWREPDGVFYGESLLVDDGCLAFGPSRALCLTQSASSIELARSLILPAAASTAKATNLMYRSDVGDVALRGASLRVKMSLKKLQQRGGRRLMLRLSPAANASLELLIATGQFQSATEAINLILMRAASNR